MNTDRGRCVRSIGLNLDQIDDADNAAQASHIILRRLFLEVVRDGPGQCNHPFFNFDLNLLAGHFHIPAQNPHHAFGDLFVRSLMRRRWMDHDLLRDAAYALDPSGRAFGRKFFREGGNNAAEGHHAVACRYTDMGGIYLGDPNQFVHHHRLHRDIVTHDRSPIVTVKPACGRHIQPRCFF